MWQVEAGEHSKSFSFLALTAWQWRFVEYMEEKAHRLTEWINDEGVCRTTPATPGLLKGQGNKCHSPGF